MNTGVRETISGLLDMLWRERTDYNLGAHSRQWPHDATKDSNTLFDYIQFVDFSFPNEIKRLEDATSYTYQVSDDLIQRAVNMTPLA
ncbi:MAG: hypothetical protein K0S39_2448 [Paenibacillus sp.]|nr:hypothetical protein [Paenibacillus sp.]